MSASVGDVMKHLNFERLVLWFFFFSHVIVSGFPFFVFVYNSILKRFSLFSSIKVKPGEVWSVRQSPFFHPFSTVAEFNQIIYASGDWNEKCGAVLFHKTNHLFFFYVLYSFHSIIFWFKYGLVCCPIYYYVHI